MNTLLVVIISAAIVSILPLYVCFKERKARRKAEEMLSVVKSMGQIDDRIFRMRMDDPEDWPESREAQMLIVHRLALHERYSAYLGHQLLRDCDYMNELMRSVISK